MAKWWEKYDVTQAEWNKMSPGAQKLTKRLHESLEKKKFQETSTLNPEDQVLATTLDRQQVLLRRIQESEKAMRSFAGQGYGLAEDAPLIAGIDRAIKLTDTYLGNVQNAREAMNSLANAFPTSQFETLGSVMKDSLGDLAANAATLDTLGLSYRSFSKNLDIAIYSFNQSEASVSSLNQQLFDFSRQVGQLPSVVSNNFQLVAQSLSYSFPKIKEEFEKIQELSAKTGVSVNKLMGTFGQQADTISGASSFAASMNTLLGKNVFSATQVLMMSESERMTATRDALRESQIYKDYMSGDDKLQKFALNAISKRLQMSPDETRRFLDEGRVGSDTDKGASLKSRMADQVQENFAKSANLLNKSIGSLVDAISGNADIINLRRRTATNADLQIMRQSYLKGLDDPSLSRSGQEMGGYMLQQQKLGMQAVFGKSLQDSGAGVQLPSTNEIATMMVTAGRSTQEGASAIPSLLRRAYEALAAEPLLDTPFINSGIVAALNNQDFPKAKMLLEEFLSTTKDFAPADDDRVSEAEAKLYQDIEDPTAKRRFLRKIRIEDLTQDQLNKIDQDMKRKGKKTASVRRSPTRTAANFGRLDESDYDTGVLPGGTPVEITVVARDGSKLIEKLAGQVARVLST